MLLGDLGTCGTKKLLLQALVRVLYQNTFCVGKQVLGSTLASQGETLDGELLGSRREEGRGGGVACL